MGKVRKEHFVFTTTKNEHWRRGQDTLLYEIEDKMIMFCIQIQTGKV